MQTHYGLLTRSYDWHMWNKRPFLQCLMPQQRCVCGEDGPKRPGKDKNSAEKHALLIYHSNHLYGRGDLPCVDTPITQRYMCVIFNPHDLLTPAMQWVTYKGSSAQNPPKFGLPTLPVTITSVELINNKSSSQITSATDWTAYPSDIIDVNSCSRSVSSKITSKELQATHVEVWSMGFLSIICECL